MTLLIELLAVRLDQVLVLFEPRTQPGEELPAPGQGGGPIAQLGQLAAGGQGGAVLVSFQLGLGAGQRGLFELVVDKPRSLRTSMGAGRRVQSPAAVIQSLVEATDVVEEPGVAVKDRALLGVP